MEPMKINEIVQATGGQLVNGNGEVELVDISTDSRNIKEGMFFIPLKGEKFDGHDFIPKSFEAGAVGCIVEKDINIEFHDKCVIKVGNSLKALQDIARYYRQKFSIPFVAVTGSVGKTTTKDMIACVLDQKYKVLKTLGNFNNEIGLPLTVFRLNRTHHIGVTEMGMSGFGEISRLVSIVKPETAVITNIGLSHIEKLGSQENILKAKMEVFEEFDKDSLAILNGDDRLLFNLKGNLPFRIIYYGIYNDKCELKAQDISYHGEEGSSFSIIVDGATYTVRVPVMGEHNIYNALASIAAGMEYGISMNNIIKGIALFKPEKMRMDIFESKGIKVINDCYNASPASMAAALKVLKQIHNEGRKIAILGDMLEMGEWAFDAHKKVGSDVVKNNIDYLMTVGYNGKNIALGALQAGMAEENIFSFDNNDEVIKFIDHFIKCGDAVLIKASRGMKMEGIAEHIREVR
ncbi:MAG: UDP-N-acetylmuramoyl-tripeptide--D-alanyl-D-alanine ligase [Clostridia bacterium]|nr:UDP-N-acetylmuramoyl-tripeptide--D-alanyl-D-alanine ligase [Clostridia bacterium]